MLDPGQIRVQIIEAKETHKKLLEQRAQIETRVNALETYIAASEGMLASIEPQQSPDQMPLIVRPQSSEEGSRSNPGVREHGFRGLVLQSLRDANGALTLDEIWERARELGATTKISNKTHAVQYALYDMKRRGLPIRKTSPTVWEYVR